MRREVLAQQPQIDRAVLAALDTDPPGRPVQWTTRSASADTLPSAVTSSVETSTAGAPGAPAHGDLERLGRRGHIRCP
ncbi:hypothetical protein GLX30_23450 [Streptomyces sp. Tu 2975]|uniref:hypothetical protein n=1 Tax=Streptomyces sp. Tu 2975 TaxID=2676871 RepID=UPI0013595555|nr:hypothetical protein [Streptomyces sp. Tu 2975]QIP86483.1 hypothetical protein GLX30_23450 [Streptomyces sp. Tu 2975]